MKGNLLVDVISLEWALSTAEFRGSNRDIRAVLYLWYPDLKVKSDSSPVVLSNDGKLWLGSLPVPDHVQSGNAEPPRLKRGTFIPSLPSTCSPQVVAAAASCSPLWVILDGIIFVKQPIVYTGSRVYPLTWSKKFCMAEREANLPYLILNQS